jgi:hypothetical protein
MRDVLPDPLDAPPYVVTCLEVDRGAGEGHEHVAAVETRDPDGGQTRWTTVQVIAAVREGERFVVGDSDDARTSLEPAGCPRCSTATLRVSPGDVEIAPCVPA